MYVFVSVRFHRPWHLLDDNHAAAAAVHTPHGVQKQNGNPPQKNELKAPFTELVVAGSRLMAAGTDGGGALARPDPDLNTPFL
jgi:hypothetical protein